MLKKPRVGLIGEFGDFGGTTVSSGHLSELLSDSLEMVPIRFAMSGAEEDWAGRVEVRERPGRSPAYVVFAADFNIERILVPELGDQMLNKELRVRSWAEQALSIARRERLDAIHVYGGYGELAFIGAYVSALIDKPLVLTFCGQDLERRIFGAAYPHLKAAAEQAVLVTCKSEKAQRIVERLLRPAAPIRIIRNHVAEADFDLEAVVERRGDDPVIGCFGEFRRVVGLDVLLCAYGTLVTQRPLTLALGGPIRATEAAYFNRRIEALPEQARVWRMGRIPHARMLAACRACDLIVAPSYADTSPFKVLEAMLAGVPLVTTTAGGIPELVTPEHEALLIEPGDAEGLAQAIARILDDPELGRSLAERARARVLSEFTRERERGDWLAAYRASEILA
ncbi:glycosyltransferase [Thiocapsa bogorovii]|uniref:glycosyltransferase n=1 Tax=Thiocapsa bogorovii TaxID=521689 RepID=UPI001E2E9E82|nr:glycosyltransferase [Thiocapsa bogorovii]UHD14522.1 glycosyltransferase [Thiocapsa bogorovii]